MNGDPEELTGVVIPRHERQLHALEVTHPGWRIRITRGGWWAERYATPTLEQRAAGVVQTVARETAESLAVALARFDEITSRIR